MSPFLGDSCGGSAAPAALGDVDHSREAYPHSVACGGAVATSTMAAEEIKELCADHNIELDLVQCRVNEIETYMDGADLICTTARVERTFGDIPVVHGMPFVSGVGIEALQQKILGILAE